MTVHSRRALRVTATLAGVAALGATFSGTAVADESEQGGVDQDNSVRNDSDTDSEAYLDDSSSDRTRSADLGLGPTTQLDLFDFSLPTSGPSLAPAKKDKDDDGFDSQPNSTGPHHYHPGSNEAPYDFDLYNPLEKYGSNGCKDKGADRAPLYAMQGGFGGFNGQADRDCKVGSKDYEPEDTAYKGKDKSSGYSGYVGTDRSRQ